MSTITTLNVGDTGAVSRTVINQNLANLNTDKAETASPTFTGNPTAPTQLSSDNSTKLATTAFVATAVATTDISCHVYQTAATGLTTTQVEYVMDFGAERFDTDTMHNNAVNPSRITFTTAGKYMIGGTAHMTANNVDIRLSVRVDGATTIVTSGYSGSNGTNHGANVSILYDFTAGQYVEFLASTISNGQTTSGDLKTHAWAVKVN